MRALVGYPYESGNVPAEILLEIADELLRHGAHDVPGADGSRALASAEFWVGHGRAVLRPVRDRLRTAGWSTRDRGR
jgi:hypothetical protein